MTACLSFHWQRVLPHFCLGMRRNKAFRFSHLSFFAFSFDILKSIGLASNLKKSEKALIIETGNFYHGVHVVTCSRNKSRVFTQLLPFSYKFQAALSWSLWPGYQWKDLSLLQKLSIDCANFGQRWWHRNWNRERPRLITAGYGPL